MTLSPAQERQRHNETQLRHWKDQLRHAREPGKRDAAAFWVNYYEEQVARCKRTIAAQNRTSYGR